MLKIRRETALSELEAYGFTKTIKAPVKANYDMSDNEQANKYFSAKVKYNEQAEICVGWDWYYSIGYSRRGQWYGLLISEADKVIHVEATEPDGSGGAIALPVALLQMFNDNLIVEV